MRGAECQAAVYEVGHVSEAGIGTGVSVSETGGGPLSIGETNFLSCQVCHLLLHPKPEKK